VFCPRNTVEAMMLVMVVIRGRLEPVTSSSLPAETDASPTQRSAVTGEEITSTATATAGLYLTLVLCHV